MPGEVSGSYGSKLRLVAAGVRRNRHAARAPYSVEHDCRAAEFSVNSRDPGH